jgi:hypothetical protein
MVFRQELGHVGPVAAAAGNDRATGLRMDAELAVAGRLGKELLGLLDGQLVRRDALRHVRPNLAALQIRAVAPDAEDDVFADPQRIDGAGVDLT